MKTADEWLADRLDGRPDDLDAHELALAREWITAIQQNVIETGAAGDQIRRLREALERIRRESHWTTIHQIIDEALGGGP